MIYRSWSALKPTFYSGRGSIDRRAVQEKASLQNLVCEEIESSYNHED